MTMSGELLMCLRFILFTLFWAIIVFLPVSDWIDPAQAMPPASVRVQAAKLEKVQEWYRVTGSIRAVSRSRVAALEDGRVDRITVTEGDHVKKGQLLAKIDDRRLVTRLKEADASRGVADATAAQRRAEMHRTQKDFYRAKSLLETDAFSEQQYDQAREELTVAQARLLSAERRLTEIDSMIERLKVRLEDTTIEAPFNGRVVEQHAEIGEWIRAGGAIVTLVSSGSIEAWLEVPERFASAVSEIKSPLKIEIPSIGRSRIALKARFVPQVHPRSRTFQYVADLDNSDGSLAPGFSVFAWVPVSTEAERVTVPKNAVIRAGASAYVYKVVPDGKGGATAAKIPVQVDFETLGQLALGAGSLKAGDRVVVEGNERLTPGSPIRIAELTEGRSSHVREASHPNESRVKSSIR
jgi:RND family efflux transporter MFP subunit